MIVFFSRSLYVYVLYRSITMIILLAKARYQDSIKSRAVTIDQSISNSCSLNRCLRYFSALLSYSSQY